MNKRKYQLILESVTLNNLGGCSAGQVIELYFPTIEDAWRQAQIEAKTWNRWYSAMGYSKRVKVKMVRYVRDD